MSTTTTITSNIDNTEDLDSSITNDIIKLVLKKNKLPITKSKSNTTTGNKSNIIEPYYDIKWLTGC